MFRLRDDRHDLLWDRYVKRNDITNVKKLTQEMKIIEKEFSQAHNVEIKWNNRKVDETNHLVSYIVLFRDLESYRSNSEGLESAPGD